MKRVTIRTGARLHFGLLDTKPPFGGIGAMVSQPQTVVTARESKEFSADSTIESRATQIAKRFTAFLGNSSLPTVAISTERLIPQHVGFGSGTQLSLAIAECLCELFGLELDFETLSRDIADRGKRSAVGTHGYREGGFIFETAGDSDNQLNPVRERLEICSQWRVALIRPKDKSATHGDAEKQHFQRLERADQQTRHELHRIIESEVLPAIRANDFPTFAESIERYNHASGMMFAPVQGGAYNGQEVTALVQKLKSMRVPSIGQSSWGPCLFAWFPDQTSASEFQQAFSSEDVVFEIAEPLNRGRLIEKVLAD